ncbi:hypothetical protein [Bradyrhizobium sp. USDA 3364]
MIRKLEIDAARADLAAVEGLLARRSRVTDPVGWMQFSKRKEEIETQLAKLHGTPATGAAVALFFGGLPVFGSRGIKAEFGTKAVGQFQDVVTKRFAEYQGPIGSRGPTKQADQTAMMITDVARGSFGFVLEEVERDDQHLVESPLRLIVDDVLDLIYQTSAPDEEAFNAFVESVDPRVLTSLRTFFQTLDNEGATMRIVEDEREFSLPREAISRARGRTDTLQMTEDARPFEGRLYLLPDSKKFELHLEDGSSMRGSVAQEFLKPLLTASQDIPDGILGMTRVVLVRVRTIEFPNAPAKKVFRLLSFADDAPRNTILHTAL